MAIKELSPQVMDRLDAIAYSAGDPSTDEVALDLVEQAAAVPGALRILVERYAAAPNVLVPRAVSFVLAQQSDSSAAEPCALTLALAARLGASEDPSTLLNCLTALQRCLIFKHRTVFQRSDTSALFRFILHCLSQPPLVQSTAIRLLTLLNDDASLQEVFEPAQVAALRRKLGELTVSGDPFLGKELEDLSAFLANP